MVSCCLLQRIEVTQFLVCYSVVTIMVQHNGYIVVEQILQSCRVTDNIMIEFDVYSRALLKYCQDILHVLGLYPVKD